MKIAFLLGSGSSRHAGMPTTDKITERVLAGTYVHRCTDGRYSIAEDVVPGLDRSYVDASIALAKWVHEQMSRYYETRRSHSTNYESIAYVLSQVAETISGNFDNPAVIPLIEKMEGDETIAEFFAGQTLQSASHEAAN